MQKIQSPSIMDGEAVFEFAINDVIRWVTDFTIALTEKGVGDYQFYSFHQAITFH